MTFYTECPKKVPDRPFCATYHPWWFLSSSSPPFLPWTPWSPPSPPYVSREHLKAEVSESVFSISRREWEFLLFNLVHRDETENSWHLLSGFETRPRKNFLQSQASRRDRDLLSSLSGFETRTRIPLIWSRFSRRDREFWKLPSFPEFRLERPHYFACNCWEANYIKCRASHFAWCSPILKWPSHVLRVRILVGLQVIKVKNWLSRI